MTLKLGVLRNSANFTRKHFCWSLFKIKLQAFRSATLLKWDPNRGVFLWNFAKFLSTPILTERLQSGVDLVLFWQRCNDFGNIEFGRPKYCLPANLFWMQKQYKRLGKFRHQLPCTRFQHKEKVCHFCFVLLPIIKLFFWINHCQWQLLTFMSNVALLYSLKTRESTLLVLFSRGLKQKHWSEIYQISYFSKVIIDICIFKITKL